MLNHHDWVYRGEGNANLVLSYTGNDLKVKGKILRIQKCNLESLTHLKNYTKLSHYSPQEIVFFRNKFMKNLLGDQFVNEMKLVKLNPEFLSKVQEQIESQRSLNRRKHQIIDVNAQYAILDEDATFVDHQNSDFHESSNDNKQQKMDIISVEIKPKWSKISNTHSLAADNWKRSYCRFCMHQYHKRDLGKVSVLSDYCPIDLYSEMEDKMLNSVKSLFSTPQNNFKLFLNGHVVEDWEIIENKMKENKIFSHPQDNYLHLQYTLVHSLMKSGVMRKLSLLQQRHDPYGIEHVYNIYNTLNEEEIASLDNVLFEQEDKQSVNEKILKIQYYLTSMTLRDCSIIVTFYPKSIYVSEAEVHRQRNNTFSLKESSLYGYNIRLIDLDPKHHSKIPYYHELDQIILKHFDTIVDKKPPCHGHAFNSCKK